MSCPVLTSDCMLLLGRYAMSGTERGYGLRRCSNWDLVQAWCDAAKSIAFPHTPGTAGTDAAAFGFDSGGVQGPMSARVPPLRHRLAAAKSIPQTLLCSTNRTRHAAVRSHGRTGTAVKRVPAQHVQPRVHTSCTPRVAAHVTPLLPSALEHSLSARSGHHHTADSTQRKSSLTTHAQASITMHAQASITMHAQASIHCWQRVRFTRAVPLLSLPRSLSLTSTLFSTPLLFLLTLPLSFHRLPVQEGGPAADFLRTGV
eukprot:1966649-Rhodomonas_salina.1